MLCWLGLLGPWHKVARLVGNEGMNRYMVMCYNKKGLTYPNSVWQWLSWSCSKGLQCKMPGIRRKQDLTPILPASHCTLDCFCAWCIPTSFIFSHFQPSSLWTVWRALFPVPGATFAPDRFVPNDGETQVCHIHPHFVQPVVDPMGVPSWPVMQSLQASSTRAARSLEHAVMFYHDSEQHHDKTCLWGCDQVRLKPACSATQAS